MKFDEIKKNELLVNSTLMKLDSKGFSFLMKLDSEDFIKLVYMKRVDSLAILHISKEQLEEDWDDPDYFYSTEFKKASSNNKQLLLSTMFCASKVEEKKYGI